MKGQLTPNQACTMSGDARTAAEGDVESRAKFKRSYLLVLDHSFYLPVPLVAKSALPAAVNDAADTD